MGCATTSFKISSIVINILLAIISVGVIVYCAIYGSEYDNHEPLALIIVGVLIILFTVLGCFGALRESLCLTATCAAFLLVLTVVHIACLCLYWNSTEERSGIETVQASWRDGAMDSLQQDHECCGRVSAHDYILVNKPIPASCYADQDTSRPESFYLDGCIAKLQDYYASERLNALISSIVLIAFEFAGFLLAVFLVIDFRNKQRRLQF